jgi:hypothetical protein
MTREEFKTYKKAIIVDRLSIANILIQKYNIFAIDSIQLTKDLTIINFIVKYFTKDLIIANEVEFDINIVDYATTIKLSELLNKKLKKQYKPTFLLDITNYKSIRELGF